MRWQYSVVIIMPIIYSVLRYTIESHWSCALVLHTCDFIIFVCVGCNRLSSLDCMFLFCHLTYV